MTAYLVHIGYLFMLAAFLVRDILWLRTMLVCAQLVLVTYAVNIGVQSIAGWNLLFAGINVAWIVRILNERRTIALPAPLRRIYEMAFTPLTPGEFLRLWNLGRQEWMRDTQIMWAGSRPEALFFLLAGSARVVRSDTFVCDLVPGQFIGEMSLITGQPANADVSVLGEAEVVWWPMADLLTLKTSEPALWSRLQSVIGHDLVDKIIRGDAFRQPMA
ncbi:MAG: Crp/Fnr family transcriptional regulator [Vicinamibacterales bacterium]